MDVHGFIWASLVRVLRLPDLHSTALTLLGRHVKPNILLCPMGRHGVDLDTTSVGAPLRCFLPSRTRWSLLPSIPRGRSCERKWHYTTAVLDGDIWWMHSSTGAPELPSVIVEHGCHHLGVRAGGCMRLPSFDTMTKNTRHKILT